MPVDFYKHGQHTRLTRYSVDQTSVCWCVPQGRALSELRSLEETSAALVSSIQEGTLAKRQLLDDLIEAERQIMLSERKMQLEKEMQVGPRVIVLFLCVSCSCFSCPGRCDGCAMASNDGMCRAWLGWGVARSWGSGVAGHRVHYHPETRTSWAIVRA